MVSLLKSWLKLKTRFRQSFSGPSFIPNIPSARYFTWALAAAADIVENEEIDKKRKGRHLSGRRHGSFVCSFRVPDGIDADKIEKAFSRGDEAAQTGGYRG